MGSNVCDFKCDDCGHIWEFVKAMPHHQFPSREVECPNCKSTNTFRKYGTPHVVVKPGTVGNAANGYTNTEGGMDRIKKDLKKIKKNPNVVME